VVETFVLLIWLNGVLLTDIPAFDTAAGCENAGGAVMAALMHSDDYVVAACISSQRNDVTSSWHRERRSP
jgi:hypothetical protein